MWAHLVQLVKGVLCYSAVIPRLGNLIISDLKFMEESCNNNILKAYLNAQAFPSKKLERNA